MSSVRRRGGNPASSAGRADGDPATAPQRRRSTLPGTPNRRPATGPFPARPVLGVLRALGASISTATTRRGGTSTNGNNGLRRHADPPSRGLLRAEQPIPFPRLWCIAGRRRPTGGGVPPRPRGHPSAASVPPHRWRHARGRWPVGRGSGGEPSDGGQPRAVAPAPTAAPGRFPHRRRSPRAGRVPSGRRPKSGGPRTVSRRSTAPPARAAIPSVHPRPGGPRFPRPRSTAGEATRVVARWEQDRRRRPRFLSRRRQRDAWCAGATAPQRPRRCPAGQRILPHPSRRPSSRGGCR